MLIRTFVGTLLLAAVSTAGDVAAKGSGPTSIAAGYGSVWIGMGSGQVIGLPSSLTGPRRVLDADSQLAFVHGLTARYGALWVLRHGVTRFGPGRDTAREVPGVASSTFVGVAAGAGAIWVTDDGSNQILRIDPQRLTVT